MGRMKSNMSRNSSCSRPGELFWGFPHLDLPLLSGLLLVSLHLLATLYMVSKLYSKILSLLKNAHENNFCSHCLEPNV